MRRRRRAGDDDTTGGRRARLGVAALSRLKLATDDWLAEQDRRREAEQRRFAQERVRLRLEALWALPPWSAPGSS